jgi:hypothetical protein
MLRASASLSLPSCYRTLYRTVLVVPTSLPLPLQPIQQQHNIRLVSTNNTASSSSSSSASTPVTAAATTVTTASATEHKHLTINDVHTLGKIPARIEIHRYRIREEGYTILPGTGSKVVSPSFIIYTSPTHVTRQRYMNARSKAMNNRGRGSGSGSAYRGLASVGGVGDGYNYSEYPNKNTASAAVDDYDEDIQRFSPQQSNTKPAANAKAKAKTTDAATPIATPPATPATPATTTDADVNAYDRSGPPRLLTWDTVSNIFHSAYQFGVCPAWLRTGHWVVPGTGRSMCLHVCLSPSYACVLPSPCAHYD